MTVSDAQKVLLFATSASTRCWVNWGRTLYNRLCNRGFCKVSELSSYGNGMICGWVQLQGYVQYCAKKRRLINLCSVLHIKCPPVLRFIVHSPWIIRGFFFPFFPAASQSFHHHKLSSLPPFRRWVIIPYLVRPVLLFYSSYLSAVDVHDWWVRRRNK